MRTRFVAFVVALFTATSTTHAADAAKLVAPYLDDQTIGVIHVDLATLDLDVVFDRIAKTPGANAPYFADVRKSLQDGIAAFRKAGANDLYVVFSGADLPQPGPFILVPKAGVNLPEFKAAIQQMGMGGRETVEPMGDVIFAGIKTARDRLRGVTPAPRPDLEKALAAVAAAPVQVALVPSADQRRAVGETIATLPNEVGGGPGTILTKGVRWAALGVETKPKLAVKLVAKSDNAAAAKALADTINHGLDTALKDNAARQMFPKLDDMVKQVRPKVEGDQLTIAADESNPAFAAEITSGLGKMRQAADRDQSFNNLKQIGLASHNFLSVNNTFPADIKSKDGKPLLSWRVAILPYIEEGELYKQFHQDEPWDSEHNKKLIEKMPKIYRTPAQKVGGGKTCYLAPTGMVDKVHVGVLGSRIQDITDGTSNTIMYVETNDEAAVEWTKPADLTVDSKEPFKGLIGHYEGRGFPAGLADGSVRFIAKSIDSVVLIGLFTRDGGEVINLP
jgi:hypothetical protein